MRAKLVAVSGTILLLTALYFALGAAFCAAALHVPRRAGEKPDGAVPAQIITKDKVTLRAWWFPHPTGNRSCVVVLHGIGDSRSSSAGFASLFLHRGYSVLTPDSRAHGDSGGQFVTYGLLERYDIISWAHWMREQGCLRIYGLGESLGASILLQAIAIEPVFRAIVAESPYADLRQMAQSRLVQQLSLPQSFSRPLAALLVEAGMDYALIFHHLNFRLVSPPASLRCSRTPVLLIHGLHDERTPPEQSRLLAKARPQDTDLWLVPNASHTDASVVAPTEFQRRVFRWFEASY